MNIFVLDEDPKKAAEYHCDKHICKMILEAGQMLCTAHWMSWMTELGKTRSDFRLMRDVKEYLRANVPLDKQPPWSITHVNHPCSVWTRETLENYNWHHKLMGHLLDEYTVRYGKMHKSLDVWRWLFDNKPMAFPSTGATPFAICMKEDYKISSDPVVCYRQYYVKDKVRFAKWRYSKTPTWWTEYFKPEHEALRDSVLNYIVDVLEPPRKEFAGMPACPFVRKERMADKLLVDVFDHNTETFLEKVNFFKESKYTDAVFAQPMDEKLSRKDSSTYQKYLQKVLNKTFKEYKVIVANPHDSHGIDSEGFNPRSLAPCLLIVLTDFNKIKASALKLKKTKYYDNLSAGYRELLKISLNN